MRLILSFFLILFISACSEPEIVNPIPATPPVSTISVTPQNTTIDRGTPSSHRIFVQVDDPDLTVSEAVIFLNVLYMIPDGGGAYESALGYFSNPSITNNIFARVLTGEQIRKGLSARLFYTIRDEAPIGQYTINVQVFRGPEINPAAVKVEDRIGIYNIEFNVE